jgi:hypothetical protein
MSGLTESAALRLGDVCYVGKRPTANELTYNLGTVLVLLIAQLPYTIIIRTVTFINLLKPSGNFSYDQV